MDSPAVRGVIIVALAYVLAVATFLVLRAPPMVAVYLGGTYALTALASLMFARGLLEFFIGVEREIAFFVVMRRITDPLMALIHPLTPGFLAPFAVSLYAAFLFFFLKVFLFGDAFLGVPPLFILLYVLLAALI